MHPYRTLWQAAPPAVDVEAEPGLRLAVWVMTVVGAVEAASALPRGAPVSLQTLFGAICVVAGVAWLMRHAGVSRQGRWRVARAGGSRRRPR